MEQRKPPKVSHAWESRKEIALLYKRGQGLAVLAKQFKCAPTTVRKIVRAEGGEIRAKNENICWECKKSTNMFFMPVG